MNDDVKMSRQRRPRGSLSREEIVEAALALADESGLAGLTMPSLARRLDCGVMTLYGYLESKRDLLEAIVQRGLQDLQFPRPMPTDATGVLSTWGRTLRTTLVRHPVLPAIFLDQPMIGPAILRGVEALLGALSRAGYPPKAGAHAIYAVLIYTVGFVAWELPRTHGQAEEAYARTWRQVAAGLPSTEFPIATTVLDELGAVAGEQQFDTGLAALTLGLVMTGRPGVKVRSGGDGGESNSPSRALRE